MMPKITLLFASLHVLLMLFLAYRVVDMRRTKRVGVGDGGDADLARTIRVHANFIENVPLALLLLALLELCAAPAMLVCVFGTMLLLARILHAIGFSRYSGTSFGRFWGTLLTWLSLLGMAGTGIWRVLLQG